MTIIDYIAQYYETGYGVQEARTIRRKAVETLNIFGRGNRTESPFRPIREALPEIWRKVLADVGPCTRAQVVAAIHAVADAQELAEYQKRKNR